VPKLQFAAAEKAGTLDKQVYADTTFPEVWRRELGGEIITAEYHGTGHTSGDVTVMFEKANVVHMGDLMFNRLYPRRRAPQRRCAPRQRRRRTALLRRARVLSYEENGIPLHPLKYQAGIRSAACLSAARRRPAVGALYIDLRSGRRFSDDELLVLDTFVQSAAGGDLQHTQFEGIKSRDAAQGRSAGETPARRAAHQFAAAARRHAATKFSPPPSNSSKSSMVHLD